MGGIRGTLDLSIRVISMIALFRILDIGASFEQRVTGIFGIVDKDAETQSELLS
jgi:hypothetical protein